MILTRTPYRVSLAGGGTDFPSWFRENGGVVVGGAVSRYCHVSVRSLPPFHSFRNRVAYRRVETTPDVDSIEHPAVRACLKLLGVDGVEVCHTGDLPGRSGVGSSSSFVVGLLHALHALKKEFLPQAELAREAMRVEQELLGETVGCQDQLLAALGGLNVIHFRPSGEMEVTPLGLPPGRRRELESHLLLLFTGVERTSSEVASTYAADWESRREANFANARLAGDALGSLRRGDWERLGWVLDQAMRVKLSLSPAVAYGGLHAQYAEFRLAGAWGGKLTGAGGGGSLLLAAPPGRHEKILSAASRMGMVHVPFTFEEGGTRVVYSG